MNKDLTVGKPESVLWKFCIPLLGSVIFQQLYNIADSLIAGRCIGKQALAAVGNSYEITLIYLAFAFGCNIGCSVVVSRLYGAKQIRDMKTAISTTFIFTGILCLALMLIGFTYGELMLKVINTPDDIFTPSLLYLNIYTLGLVFLFFYNIATGIFSALGDSKTPFVFLAFSSVSNVLVDYIFVKYLHMGIAGVAWATFLCQGVSCVASLVVLFKRLKNTTHSGDKAEKTKLFSGKIFLAIIKIAIPSTLQQSFISVGNIFIQGIINGFGSSVIAGYSAAIKLNNMVITTFSALGNGMSNFTAQNIGAGKNDRIKKGIFACLKLAFLICVPVIIMYFFFGGFFVNIFMNKGDAHALKVGVDFLKVVAWFYLVISLKLVCDGVLRGTGSMTCFMIATFSDLILRVVLAYKFSKLWGYIGIWSAWPVGWTIGTILSIIFVSLIVRRLETNKESRYTYE